MLEPLAGRLKWERLGVAIRVVIPDRFDIGPLGDIMLVAIIPVLVIDVVSKADPHWSGWSWEKISLAFLGFIILAVLLMLTRRTAVLLTPLKMTIQRGPFGVNWRWRKITHATRNLYSLRAVPSISDWTGKKMRGRRTIQYDEDFSTRDLAKQLTETEAARLIEVMREVHPFPPQPELVEATPPDAV
jgi:hypothetical protein